MARIVKLSDLSEEERKKKLAQTKKEVQERKELIESQISFKSKNKTDEKESKTEALPKASDIKTNSNVSKSTNSKTRSWATPTTSSKKSLKDIANSVAEHQEEKKENNKFVNKSGLSTIGNDAVAIGSNLLNSANTGILQFAKTVNMRLDEAENARRERDKELLETAIKYREEDGEDVSELKSLLDSDRYKEVDSKPYYQEKIEKLNTKMAENTEKTSNMFSKKIAELSQSLGNNIVGAGITTINPIAGTTYFIGSATGSYYDEAVAKGMDENDAKLYAGIMGSMEGATEAFLSAQNIKGFRSILEGQTAKDTLKAFGLEIGENFIQEAVMEPLSELTTKVTGGNQFLKNDYRTVDGWKNLLTDSFFSGVDGALSAILLNGATKGVASATKVVNKLNSGAKPTQTEIKTAVKDSQQAGVNVEAVLQEQIINSAEKNLSAQNQNAEQINNTAEPIDVSLPIQKYKYEKSENVKVDNFRKEASIYFDNSLKSKRYIKMLEQIIIDKDIDIRFDGNLKTADGRMANGSYSNGVITINPNSTRAGEFVAIHELTHAIGTEQMIDMINNYRKSNAEFNSAVEELLKNYNTTEINEEALADVSAQLFGNQEFINNLAQSNPNLFQKIYNEIKYLWHQFTGYRNQDQFINDLRYKWEQAYRSNSQLNGTTNYYIENIENFDEIRYNNAQEIKLPKQEYAILSGIVNSDSNIKPGRNYVETTNATYEVYFKETGEFKVVGKIVDGGYNDTITDGTIQRIGNARNAESGMQVYSSDVQQQRTGTHNDEISNINQRETHISDTSVRNGSSNSDNVKYSIAGRTAMNNSIMADSSNIVIEQSYNKALQMANNNIDNEIIRKTTNWFQDKNGDWKFEFSDKDMSLKDIKLKEGKTYKLGDILEHDILFMAYPELANYDVKILTNTKSNGSFNRFNKTINISNKLIKNNKSVEGTLIHEIQHAIQNIEGFERGKSSKRSKLAYYNSLGEIEATNTKERFIKEKYKNVDISNIAPESSKSNPKHSGLNKYLKNRNIVDKIKDSIYNYFNNKSNYGGNSNEINQEIILDNTEQNNSLVDGGRNLNNNIENSENSKKSSFSMQNNKWQSYLDENFKATGTRTNLKDIQLSTSKENQSKEINLLPKYEKSTDKYNKYKKQIISDREKTINNLISFKNNAIRKIDTLIKEKELLLDSKKNKETKTYALIKSQIENLKVSKSKIENLYNERIDKNTQKVNKEKIELETKNMMKQDARNLLRAEIEPLTQDLTKFKDKNMGILFNRETAQRNIDDIVQDKELANTIKETIFNPVQVHQAQKKREIKKVYEEIEALDIDKTKKYYYIPEGETSGINIDEATLAQLLIEKKINDNDLRNYHLTNDHIKKIHKVADTFSRILDDLYNKMNEEQIRFGYSPIGKLDNYFPHFSENKPDTMIGKIASYFGIDLTNQNLPTEIAGLTDTFKPGRTWNSNIQKRKTNKTDYDALKAMEKYIQGATDIIYTTEDIQKIREFSKEIRYKYSDKGIQEEIDKITSNNELTQEAKDNALDGIFSNTENELSNFVTWLDDYANTLAGKKAFADRNIERNIGRNVYNSMAGIESRIASNTIGGNLSVSLTNFAPLFQAMGTTKINYLLTGMLQTTNNNIKGLINNNKDTSFVTNSNFLTNRFNINSISQKKVTEKISDFVSIPMNAIDEFTAESIVRAKYLENIDKGIDEERALDLADKYTAKIMADRSKGALPIIFNSKNPISKLATMFQVEPNNIISNYFKDMPREAETKSNLLYQAQKLMISSYAFNTLVMAIRGGNEVLPDPIRWVTYLIKSLTGDDEEKEKANTDLLESIIGSVPFASNLAGLVGMEDIGRIPISNAMPNISNIANLFDKEADSEYKKQLLTKELLKPFYYLGLPVGGAQIKKTIEGISTINNKGSYKINKDGEKELQFPVENPNILDYFKASIFGKYAIDDSKEYAERGYKALSAKQTKTYEESNLPYKEYLEYLDANLNNKEDKINYINSKEFTAEQKWGLYKNDIFSSTVRESDGGSQLSDAEYITSNGVSKKEFINLYNKAQENDISIPTADEFEKMKKEGISLKNYIDYKVKVKESLEEKINSGELKKTQDLSDKDKINILINSNYSSKEKQKLYENYIMNKEDAKYSIIKETFTSTGLNINKYLQYKSQEFESTKVDDGTVKGKTVSGSKKEKVLNYINSIEGATYTQKLILSALEYEPSKNSDKQLIVNYVKNLSNKTAEEKLEILGTFKGVTIYKNGNYKW